MSYFREASICDRGEILRTMQQHGLPLPENLQHISPSQHSAVKAASVKNCIAEAVPEKAIADSASAATADVRTSASDSLEEATRGTLMRDYLEAKIKAGLEQCKQTGRDQLQYILSGYALFFRGANYIEYKCQYLLNRPNVKGNKAVQ